MLLEILVQNPDYDFIFLLMEYWHMLFSTSLFFYFIHQMSLMLHDPTRVKLIGKLLVGFNFVYFTGFATYFIVEMFSDKNVFACDNGIWVYMRVSELFVSVVFLAVGIKTTKKLRWLRQEGVLIVKSDQEKLLWYLIFAVIAANVAEFVDSVTDSIGNEEECDEYVSGNEVMNLIVFCFVRLLTEYLVFIVFLWVFWVSKSKETKIKAAGMKNTLNSDTSSIQAVML